MGRFLQRDPIGYVDGMGLHEGFGGNPGNYVDPSGLGWIDWVIGSLEFIKGVLKVAAEPAKLVWDAGVSVTGAIRGGKYPSTGPTSMIGQSMLHYSIKYNSLAAGYGISVGQAALMVNPYTGIPIMGYMAGEGIYKSDWEQVGASTVGLGLHLRAWKGHAREFGNRPFVWNRGSVTPRSLEVSNQIRASGATDCSVRATMAIHEHGMQGQRTFIEPLIGPRLQRTPYSFHAGVLLNMEETFCPRIWQIGEVFEAGSGKIYQNPMSWAIGEGYGGKNAKITVRGRPLWEGTIPGQFTTMPSGIPFIFSEEKR